MNDSDLLKQLGSAVYESHGEYFKELLLHGYNIDTYYNGAKGWGDVSRVLAIVSYIRGVRSYAAYLEFYNMVSKPEDGGAVSPRVYARLTGIKAKANNQTIRTRVYRQRQKEELVKLRELVALAWIDSNIQQAKDYIDQITSVSA